MKFSLSGSGIQRVLSSCKPTHSNNLKIFSASASFLEIGFSLGGWSGNAVQRNRFKRKSREIVKNFYVSKKPVNILIQTKTKIKKIKSLDSELVNLLSINNKKMDFN